MSWLTDQLSGKASPSDLISRVVIESRFLPPIVLDKPLAGGGKPNPLLTFLKPRITIETPLRGPVVTAPYGNPGPNYWPQVKAVLIAGGVIAGGAMLLRVIK